jgi:AcrR family transcriptional regulator
MLPNATRQFLKSTARRLFAERGFDGVTVRDIMEAAGQRNGASLYYYFGTKEALAVELVADGAKLIDERRNALLNAAEKGGGPSRLREVVEMLVHPSTALDGNVEEDSYIRFITMLQMTHRDLFMQALAGRWNSGYTRCLAHIRSFLPELDADILNQRLVFMSLYLNAVMSQREAALHGGRHRFWSAPNLLENYIDTIVGLLTEPSHPLARSNGRRKHGPSRTALLEAGTRF